MVKLAELKVVDWAQRWWHSSGPAKPNRRPLLKVLRDAPGDWFWARSSGPGDVLGVLVIGAVLLFGFGIGNAIAINWVVSKVPTALSGFRALKHREFMMWNRTQLYQRPGFMSEAPKPMEVDPNAVGVPPLVARLIRRAERGSRTAKLTDDWLNSRARIPGILIELGTIAIGTFIAPIPRVILFPINFVVQQVPNALSVWLSGANRDTSRFWRSGARQRSDTLDIFYARHPELRPAERAIRGVATPARDASSSVETPSGPEPVAAPAVTAPMPEAQTRRSPVASARVAEASPTPRVSQAAVPVVRTATQGRRGYSADGLA